MESFSDENITSFLRRRMDEEMAADNAQNQPFSWQIPRSRPQVPQVGWDEPNSELSADEQRHFGRKVDEVLDTSVGQSSQNAFETRSMSSSVDRLHEPQEYTQPGYMQQASPFALDNPKEMSFMEWYPEGNGILTFQNDENQLESIYNINIWIIEERCPVLAMAFENSRSGPQLYLQTLTQATALPFLRYLYTGSYALSGPHAGESGTCYEDVPTSVLFHCQLYRLGDMYDLPDLKSQAYVNVLRQCEFGCSSPEQPIDLCPAIRFIYQHLRNHENLLDAIVNYCVSCFSRHHLAQDEGFKQLAYELRPFHQDLCKNSMNREFENETASAIIQMPFKPYKPETYASREDIAKGRVEDVVYHFHASDDIETSPKKRKRPERIEASSSSSEVTLPLRPHREKPSTLKDEQEPGQEDPFERKRRASSIAGSSTPIPVALGEPEYELVPGPAPVEEASDSDFDSDSSTLVEVKHEDIPDDRTLPIFPARSYRNGLDEIPVATPEHAESDSDSEWFLV